MDNNNIAYTSISSNIRYNSFNQLNYLIKGRIADINTLKVCQIVKVNEDGTLDVKNMVCNLDAQLQPIEPPILKNMSILRTQGGTSGFQVVYKVGDIVLVGFCDRDTQAVKRSKTQSSPSTLQNFPLSSGIVLGAVYFAEQTIYVKVDDKVYIVGNTELTGTLSVSSDTSIGGNATISGDTSTTGNNEAGTYSVGGQAGATLTFVDLSGTPHSVVNGIIVS